MNKLHIKVLSLSYISIKYCYLINQGSIVILHIQGVLLSYISRECYCLTHQGSIVILYIKGLLLYCYLKGNIVISHMRGKWLSYTWQEYLYRKWRDTDRRGNQASTQGSKARTEMLHTDNFCTKLNMLPLVQFPHTEQKYSPNRNNFSPSYLPFEKINPGKKKYVHLVQKFHTCSAKAVKFTSESGLQEGSFCITTPDWSKHVFTSHMATILTC